VAPEKQKSTARLSRNIPLFFTAEFLSEIQFFFPVAVLVFQDIAGSYTIAMNVIGLRLIALAVFEIPTGVLSDKIGRKVTMQLCQLALIAALACYCLPGFADLPVYWLFIGAIFHGFCFSLWSGTSHALLYETLAADGREDQLAKYLGRMSAVGQAGLATSGLAASALLLLEFSFQDLLVYSLLPAVAGLVLVSFLTEPPHVSSDKRGAWGHTKEATRLIFSNPKLRWLTVASVVENGIGRASFALAPGFIALVWPAWMVPLYRTGQNAVGTVGFWISGSAVSRFGGFKTLFAGSLLSFITSANAYIFATIFSPLLMMLSQFSWTFTYTADLSLQQQSFSEAQRATMASVISLLTAVVGAIAAFAVGIIADYAGPQATLIIILVATIPASVITYFLFRRYR
jgi:MFS family permease